MLGPKDAILLYRDPGELQAQVSDVFLPNDVFIPLQKMVAGAFRNYNGVDPTILYLEPEEVAALNNKLSPHKDTATGGVTVTLSQLEMLGLCQVSYYAQQFHDDLGTLEELGIAEAAIPAFTRKLFEYYEAAFPD